MPVAALFQHITVALWAGMRPLQSLDAVAIHPLASTHACCPGALTIAAWVAAIMTPLFFTLARFGLLRVEADAQAAGLDKSMHGGPAYSVWDTDGCEDNAAPAPRLSRVVADNEAPKQSLTP